MGEQIVLCPGCGVKLKLKDDRVLPADAACPKCSAPLFKKAKPASGPTSTSSGRPTPAAAPVRPAKPAFRRPVEEEFDEFEEEEVEDDFEEEVRPRKRSRNKKASSGGIPGWAIGALIGVLAVGVIVGVVMLMPQSGANNVVQQPGDAPATATTPTGVATLPATGNANIPAAAHAGMVPTVPANNGAVATPAVIPSTPVAGAGILVKYQPKPDLLYYYSIDVVSDFDRYVDEASGCCMLRVQSEIPSSFSIRRENQEGSGTGFVVGSNGVIVTCAHVVDGAETIQVVIGGQTYPATVLHSDATLDLAVIKIEANGLPVVPLANSDQIQLGQSLRVIGFPLSDVLGTGIKVTQGAVSGIIDKDGQRTIQTDATINPGNSGGPVFNTRGEVVGIASAKLAGGAISQVGFCVPSSSLSGMLQRQGIVLAPPIPGQEMETPALVQKVSPAVAYIKVSAGPPAKAQVAFSYTTTMSSRKKGKGESLLIDLNLDPPASESGYLSLTEIGQPVDITNGSFAPIIMSRLPLLPFVELSKSGQSDWTNQRDISIVRQEEGQRPNSRFGPSSRFFDDMFPKQKPKIVAIQKAVERDQFHVTTNNAQQLVLSRTYELKTTDGSEPGILLTGTGSWAFDRAEGMPVTSDLKGTYKVTVSGVTITIPYSVNVKRWTKEELEKMVGGDLASIDGNADNSNGKSNPLQNADPTQGNDATHVIKSKSWGADTLALSPNGKTLAYTDMHEALFVHDLETGKEVDAKLELDGLGVPSASTYSPDGKYLLVGGYQGIIRIWSVDDEGELDSIGDYVGHSSEIQSIKVLPDNKTVISSDSDRRAKAWSLADQKEQYSITSLKREFIAIGITPDGKSGLLIDTHSEVSMFNLSDGKVTATQPVFKSHFGKIAVFSPDGNMLFIPDSYKVTCHTLNSKKPPVVIDLGESFDSIAYCPKTNEVFAGGSGKIHICDWRKETRTAILNTGTKFSGDIKKIAVSQDGRFLVAIGGEQNIFIFDRDIKKKPAEDSKNDDGKSADDENPFQ